MHTTKRLTLASNQVSQSIIFENGGVSKPKKETMENNVFYEINKLLDS
jgi:hypothetical protein